MGVEKITGFVDKPFFNGKLINLAFDQLHVTSATELYIIGVDYIRPCCSHQLFSCITEHVTQCLIDFYPAFRWTGCSHAKHGALKIGSEMLFTGSQRLQCVTALALSIKAVECEGNVESQFIEKGGHLTVEKAVIHMKSRQNTKRLATALNGKLCSR